MCGCGGSEPSRPPSTPRGQGGSSGAWVPGRPVFPPPQRSPPTWPNTPGGPCRSGEPQCAGFPLPEPGPTVMEAPFAVFIPPPSSPQPQPQHSLPSPAPGGADTAVCTPYPCTPRREKLLWQRRGSALPLLVGLFQPLKWGARCLGPYSSAAIMKGAWVLS